MKLEPFIEPIPPHGTMMAAGIKKLMGKPSLSPIHLLVREATQNSWDARLPKKRPAIRWDVRVLSSDEQHRICDLLPNALTSGGVRFATALKRCPISITLVDENTIGLAGPTRADKVKENEVANFVGFVRNIGDHTGSYPVSGGSFGYGKSSLYRSSAVGMVLAYTQTINEKGSPENRFIACQVADQVKGRHTGRAWWGKMASEVLEPVRGTGAASIAKYLGLPVPSSDRSGTSLTILAPEMLVELEEARSHEQVAAHLSAMIVEAVLWHLWPKVVAPGPNGLDVAVSLNGQDVELPDPANHQVLRHFVAAYRSAKSGREGHGTTVHSIDLLRPELELGVLALLGPQDLQLTSNQLHPSLIGDSLHHVAWLRAPELVVRYAEYRTPVNPDLSYAGVFIAGDDEAVDAAFAASEPPSHDNWVPDQVDVSEGKAAKRIVNVALKRIKEAIDKEVAPVSLVATPGSGGFGALAQYLGDLMLGAPGDAPGHQQQTLRRSGNKGVRSVARLGSGIRLVDQRGRVIGVATVRIEGNEAHLPIKAHANVVLADGTTEKEAAAGDALAEVIGWQTPTGKWLTDGPELLWTPDLPSEVEVCVAIPENAMVAISLAESRGGPA
jgi:hypothetical protein